MRVLGIDPGVKGGLAVIEITDGAAATLIAAIDVPVMGIGAKEQVDAIAIETFIGEHRPQAAFIERAQAMPRQGASSGFKYGKAVGTIEGVILTCKIPLTIVEPAQSKRFHGLKGLDKENSRQKARQLFPAAHAALARRKDHGRAEAALIALYGAARREAGRAAA